MKWFKHMSNTSDEPFMAELEALFGLEGYARWMKICESVAQQMTKGSPICSVAYPWSKWQTILKGKRNKLVSFLEHLSKKRRINLKQNGEILEIEVPEMALLRDEYSKKSGQNPEDVPSKELELDPEVETETNTEKEEVIPPRDKPPEKEKFFPQEVHSLATLLADLIEANGSKRPKVLDSWLQDIDKMIRIDKRSPADIEGAIRWCQSNRFWRSNILSAGKLREKFDTMRLQAEDDRSKATPGKTKAQQRYDAEMAELERKYG